MNDDDLKRFVKRSLAERTMPEEVRGRILSRLRRTRALWPAAAAVLAAAVVLVAVIPRGESVPAALRGAARQRARLPGARARRWRSARRWR